MASTNPLKEPCRQLFLTTVCLLSRDPVQLLPGCLLPQDAVLMQFRDGLWNSVRVLILLSDGLLPNSVR